MATASRNRAWTLGRGGVLGLLVLIVLAVAASPLRRYAGWGWRRVMGGATVSQRLEQYGPAARGRLAPFFDRAGVAYPPAEVALIGIKDRRELEVWARGEGGAFRQVRTYLILGASGHLGPKLREGDKQVPEGLYRIESLHPNSMFHLALRVNYPNEDDRRRGQADGRTDLGGDIMIHGSTGSIGCLAMGDEVAEDLFVLVGEAGVANTELILTPVDFRVAELPADRPEAPAWTDELYEEIRARLSGFVPADDRAEPKG